MYNPSQMLVPHKLARHSERSIRSSRSRKKLLFSKYSMCAASFFRSSRQAFSPRFGVMIQVQIFSQSYNRNSLRFFLLKTSMKRPVATAAALWCHAERNNPS